MAPIVLDAILCLGFWTRHFTVISLTCRLLQASTTRLLNYSSLLFLVNTLSSRSSLRETRPEVLDQVWEKPFRLPQIIFSYRSESTYHTVFLAFFSPAKNFLMAGTLSFIYISKAHSEVSWCSQFVSKYLWNKIMCSSPKSHLYFLFFKCKKIQRKD